jgi:hypothetical protein
VGEWQCSCGHNCGVCGRCQFPGCECVCGLALKISRRHTRAYKRALGKTLAEIDRYNRELDEARKVTTEMMNEPFTI